MRKLTFVNANGSELVMGDVLPLFVNKIEGTEGVDINIVSQKSPYQDGETYLENNLEYRLIYIEGTIWERDRRLVDKYKRKILQVLNPKLHLCDLEYQHNRGANKIKCIVDGAPVFPDRSREMHQRFLINLCCPNPYWQAIKDTKTDLISWIPGLEFVEGEGFWTEQTPNYWIESGQPFEEFMSEFGVGDPLEFGYRETNQIIEIDNIGDVDCPIKVVFRAGGEVERPYIQDMQTRELLRVNKTLNIGDVLEITTGFGNKNVYLNGEKAHHYLDFLNSTWLQLSPGINLIKYDAEHGLTNLECSIYHTPQYVGV